MEGCTHGDLDKTYEAITLLEQKSGQKIDLLLCCGDFQATRNLADLQCMACPDKYKFMCSFYKYYSGEKKAPILTIFIGGNHEASNYLQELPFGGWAAPNIFYLGYAGVVEVNGLRIGGLSGIYKGEDYIKGRFEHVPYSNSSMRSVYHVRNVDAFRLKQLADHPPDIILSHDWPQGVYKHGDCEGLLRMKPFFGPDIERDVLGSRPAMEVLMAVKPKYWFSGHMHVKFPAVIEHEGGSTTKFLALDKCLPRKRFLQVVDIGEPLPKDSTPRIQYDPYWLAVLRSTDHLLSVERGSCHMPGPGGNERWDFKPTDQERGEIEQILGEDFSVRGKFDDSVPAFDPQSQSLRQLRYVSQPQARQNKQTVEFCQKFNVRDPIEVLMSKQWKKEEDLTAQSTSNEIDLPEDSDDEEGVQSSAGNMSVDDAGGEESKDQGVNKDDDASFVIDTNPTLVDDFNRTWGKENQKKKLRRRNVDLYTDGDEV